MLKTGNLFIFKLMKSITYLCLILSTKLPKAPPDIKANERMSFTGSLYISDRVVYVRRKITIIRVMIFRKDCFFRKNPRAAPGFLTMINLKIPALIGKITPFNLETAYFLLTWSITTRAAINK